MTSNSTNGNEDFISKMKRFGEATQSFQWFFENPITSIIILTIFVLILTVMGITIDPVFTVVNGLVQLVNILKGVGNPPT